MRHRYQGAFRELFGEGMDSGEFAIVTDPSLCPTFVVSVPHAVRRHRTDGRPERDEISDRMCDFALEESHDH